MKPLRVLWLLFFFSAVSILNCNDVLAEQPSKDSQQSMALPVIQIAENENIQLVVRFQNTTDKPLKYFGDPKLKRPAALRLALFQDGKEIENGAPHNRVLEFPEAVRKLRPGEFIDTSFTIPWLHASSSPGIYEVRMQYQVDKQESIVTEFGITPLTIDKPILWLDVTAAKDAKPNHSK